MDDRVCAACGEAFTWRGLTIGDSEFCCAECASGKPCGCPAHTHGIPVPNADDPELVGVEAALRSGPDPAPEGGSNRPG